MQAAKQTIPAANVSPGFAHVAPFGAFMFFLTLASIVEKFGQDLPGTSFWLANPQYWIFPIQTIFCGALLWVFRRHYDFAGFKAWHLGIVAGAIALPLWIAPQAFFGKPPRTEGFNPSIFDDNPLLLYASITFRMIRLVVVVPFLEEIFWRGFLLRFFVREKFSEVPFGTWSPLSFGLVAILFAGVHRPEDWIAAILTGLLWNGLAVKTRSLGACVVAHAVTNLTLGIYILQTRQWGFW